jgi:hypothetical protein
MTGKMVLLPTLYCAARHTLVDFYWGRTYNENMSSRNPIQGPSHLDPLFPIPDGLVDFEHTDAPVGSLPGYDVEDYTELSTNEIEDEDSYYEVDDDEMVPDIDTPSTFTVISQTIRTLPSGMQVVDVVAEVEDIPGALNYEFRVVKI